MSNDFDESILENEEEFKKRFRRIERPAFIDKVVKANKNRITIMLDPDVIEHFKTEAERSHTGYQTLINQTLREIIDGSKSSDPLEKLLKNKKALKRLKAELEAV
jgi:uncharacterized protein (DUF4415 family)